MAKSKTPVKLVSYEEIMGIGDYEEVVTIAIDDIRPFKNHSPLCLYRQRCYMVFCLIAWVYL